MRVQSVLALLLTASAALAKFQDDCASLSTSFARQDTEVLVAKYIPAGTNLTFDDTAGPGCWRFPVLAPVDMCRLRLSHATSRSSSVAVEIFMPVDWMSKGRRLLMTGNGGLGGCIYYTDMAFAVKLGFAAVGHNNGHDGDTGEPFLNSPEVITDYTWRALYKAGRLAKSAIKHFYSGNEVKRSYYMGCSTGGRQGMKAAQEFPSEYDGIISSCPALAAAGLAAMGSKFYFLVGPPGSPTHLTVKQWGRVHQMVIDQCDWIDGVLDGILEDPRKCRPRPEALLCRPGESWESDQCLTIAQVNTVREFYQPMYGNGGKLLYPRWQPLTREGAGFRQGYGGVPSHWAEGWYANALHNDPEWTIPANWTLETVEKDLEDHYGLNTYNTDLSYQQGNGTKVILIHGLTDGLVTSEISYQYYDDVVRTMNLKSQEIDEFFRFFPIPGLDHCFNGEGAWYVGGPFQYYNTEAWMFDASDSVIMTMVKWVEEGIAPETLTGRSFVDGAVVAEKHHCRYPYESKYKGSGDPNLASSWECAGMQL
ncbi:Tannase and feruloyl esterase [Orbilia javanica]|uniref:Carboxylic ester hydrolase n=1 Tax=Orbilia javanica TaxID=47235 RepID=A0AAN8RH42_9PEZI